MNNFSNLDCMIHLEIANDYIKKVEIRIIDLFKKIPNLEIADLQDTIDRALDNLEEDYIGELGGEGDE